MKRLLLQVLSSLLICGPAPTAFAGDKLCRVLHKLETEAPAPGDNQRERRWVEFHWGFDHGEGAVWSWGCRNSHQPIAKGTCRWLKDHTNQEFRWQLPHRILSCYGYVIPQGADYDWKGLRGRIVLRSPPGNRLLLDLNYDGLPQDEDAMRLSIETGDGKYDPEQLPPIEPWPSERSKPPSA